MAASTSDFVATSGRTSIWVSDLMSSTAKTLAGSAMASSSRPSSNPTGTTE